jgi:lysozyme
VDGVACVANDETGELQCLEELTMRMSEKGRQLLSQWEGVRARVYNDSVGLPTIGVGHLLTAQERASGAIAIAGQPVRYANGLTPVQVQQLLEQDLARFENAVSNCVTCELDQNQFDALVSLSFNIGPEAFRNSSLVKALNQGNYTDVPDEFRRWTNAGGVESRGLVNRRENEIKLWFGEI